MFAGLAAVLLIPAGVSAADVPPTPPKGFTALFNGKDFTGWRGWAIHGANSNPIQFAKLAPEKQKELQDTWNASMKEHWKIDNGELVNKGKGAYLTSEKDYGDVELLIEYKITATVDSGIYMKTMPQIQVWDPTDPKQKANGNEKGSGGLWNNPKDWAGKDPLVKADKPAGEWNQFRIIVLGDHFTVYLNDQLVVDHAKMRNFWDAKAPLPKKAPFLLQTHAPELEIRWRNIFIREIPSEEANEMLNKKLGDGFASIFNGKDFTGWDGTTDSYEVVEGAIVCKKGKSGNIFTKKEYADFVASVEYKLPPGGNNGFALRYPGMGHVATQAMCELQVLDDTAEKYAKLDPRQFNGSAYGMAAATRGYLRPVGEWNHQVITVKGSTIKVELNGSLILDTDLSKITEFKDKTPHPGKDRSSGFFGLTGHNDPVAFRNLKIKELKP
jgi:hypothetical protein